MVGNGITRRVLLNSTNLQVKTVNLPTGMPAIIRYRHDRRDTISRMGKMNYQSQPVERISKS
jgi:hypothetical protein